jgi:hypothetical protein
MVFFMLDFCFDTRFYFLGCFLAGAPALPARLGLRKTAIAEDEASRSYDVWCDTRLGVSDISNGSHHHILGRLESVRFKLRG